MYNPGAGGPIHGQQFPVPSGQFPLNPGAAPPVAQPLVSPAPGTYYPGAEGAPSGIHQMTPGVQSVAGAISGLPGVVPVPNQPVGNQFDRAGYRDALQDWRSQRVAPWGQGHTAFENWRGLRPDKSDYRGGAPVA